MYKYLTDEALLSELKSETSRNLLQFVFGVFLGVDLDSGLGTAKGNVDARALEGHQGGQGLHFVTSDVG